MKIILIMGLPGSGKTTLANELGPMLNAKRLNADEVRKEAKCSKFSCCFTVSFGFSISSDF